MEVVIYVLVVKEQVEVAKVLALLYILEANMVLVTVEVLEAKFSAVAVVHKY